MYHLCAYCCVGHSDRSPAKQTVNRTVYQVTTVGPGSTGRCFKPDISESQPAALRTQKLGLPPVLIINLSFSRISREVKFLGSRRLKFSPHFGTFQPLFPRIFFSAIYSFALLPTHTAWYGSSPRLGPPGASGCKIPIFQVH